MTQLLPCPHCGGEALLDNSGSGNVDGRGNSLARVWCPDLDCKTHGTAYLEEWEAIKVWNRRAPVEPVDAKALLTRAAVLIARDGWFYFGDEGYALAVELYDHLGIPYPANLAGGKKHRVRGTLVTNAMAQAAANAHANSDKDKLEDWVRFVQAALDAAP